MILLKRPDVTRSHTATRMSATTVSPPPPTDSGPSFDVWIHVPPGVAVYPLLFPGVAWCCVWIVDPGYNVHACLQRALCAPGAAELEGSRISFGDMAAGPAPAASRAPRMGRYAMSTALLEALSARSAAGTNGVAPGPSAVHGCVERDEERGLSQRHMALYSVFSGVGHSRVPSRLVSDAWVLDYDALVSYCVPAAVREERAGEWAYKRTSDAAEAQLYRDVTERLKECAAVVHARSIRRAPEAITAQLLAAADVFPEGVMAEIARLYTEGLPKRSEETTTLADDVDVSAATRTSHASDMQCFMMLVSYFERLLIEVAVLFHDLNVRGGGAARNTASTNATPGDKVKMKDLKVTEILQSRALKEVFGVGFTWVLRALIGPLHGLFLRNLAWHNFLSCGEWRCEYTSLLVCVVASLPAAGFRMARRRRAPSNASPPPRRAASDSSHLDAFTARDILLYDAVLTLRRSPAELAARRAEAVHDALRWSALRVAQVGSGEEDAATQAPPAAPTEPPAPASFKRKRSVETLNAGADAAGGEDAAASRVSSFIDPQLLWSPLYQVQDGRMWAHKGGAPFDMAAWVGYVRDIYGITLCPAGIVDAARSGGGGGLDSLIQRSVFYLASREAEWRCAFAAAARGRWHSACSLATVLLESALRRMYVAVNNIDLKWQAPDKDELFTVLDDVIDPWMTWEPPADADADTDAEARAMPGPHDTPPLAGAPAAASSSPASLPPHNSGMVKYRRDRPREGDGSAADNNTGPPGAPPTATAAPRANAKGTEVGAVSAHDHGLGDRQASAPLVLDAKTEPPVPYDRLQIEPVAIAAYYPDLVVPEEIGRPVDRSRNRMFNTLSDGVVNLLYDHWVWKGGVNARDDLAHASILPSGITPEVATPILAAAVHLGRMCLAGDAGAGCGDSQAVDALDAWVGDYTPKLSPFALFAREVELYRTQAEVRLREACALIRQRGTGFPPLAAAKASDDGGGETQGATPAPHITARNKRDAGDPNALPEDAGALMRDLIENTVGLTRRQGSDDAASGRAPGTSITGLHREILDELFKENPMTAPLCTRSKGAAKETKASLAANENANNGDTPMQRDLGVTDCNVPTVDGCPLVLTARHPPIGRLVFVGKPSNMGGRYYNKVHMLRRIVGGCHHFALKVTKRYEESFALIWARKAYKKQRIAYARLIDDIPVLLEMVTLAVTFAQVNYVYRLPNDDALRETCLNYVTALVAQAENKQWQRALPDYRAFATLLQKVGGK